MKAEIDGSDVLQTGSIVFCSGQSAKIYPFDDDNNFSVEFRFVAPVDIQDSGIKMDIVPNDNKNGVVVFVRSIFRNDLTISNGEYTHFGSDEKWDFKGLFAFHVFGALERHTILVDFTVIRTGRA